MLPALVHAIGVIDTVFDRLCLLEVENRQLRAELARRRDTIVQLETQNRALSASVIRLFDQAELAEAQLERQRSVAA